MDLVALSWLVATILLTAVLLFSWKLTGSFLKAWLVMLMFGKVIAAIFYIVGLDRTVLTLRFVNRQSPAITRTIDVTAAEILFFSFLLTLIASIVSVLYLDLLPRELRALKKMYEVEE